MNTSRAREVVSRWLVDLRDLYDRGRYGVVRYPISTTMIGLGLVSYCARRMSAYPTRGLMFTLGSGSIESLMTSFLVFKQPVLDMCAWYAYGSHVERHHVGVVSYLRHLGVNAVSCACWLWMLRGEFSRDIDLCWCLGSALVYTQIVNYASIHADTPVSVLPGLRVRGIHAPWYLMTLLVVTGSWIEEYFLGMLAGSSCLLIGFLYRRWRTVYGRKAIPSSSSSLASSSIAPSIHSS